MDMTDALPRIAVRFAFDKRDLPTWPFEVASITDMLVRPATPGARVMAAHRLRPSDAWSRYRLTCRSCIREWSVEAKLCGFSCTVLFNHPNARCTCGEPCNGLRGLGWVE